MSLPSSEAEILGRPGEIDRTAATARSIQGRSLLSISWRRLKRDTVALVAGCVIVLLVLVAIFADPLTRSTGTAT